MGNRDEQLHDFFDFLSETDVETGGCTLYQSSDGKYYLSVKVAISGGKPMFIINDRFFYDYVSRFSREDPWKVLYVKER